jgi:hypothetical protein
MKVPFDEEECVPGQAELAFEGDYWNVAGRSYQPAPDGRFLVLKTLEDPQSRFRLRVVQNWFAEVERLLGSGN